MKDSLNTDSTNNEHQRKMPHWRATSGGHTLVLLCLPSESMLAARLCRVNRGFNYVSEDEGWESEIEIFFCSSFFFRWSSNGSNVCENSKAGLRQSEEKSRERVLLCSRRGYPILYWLNRSSCISQNTMDLYDLYIFICSLHRGECTILIHQRCFI